MWIRFFSFFLLIFPLTWHKLHSELRVYQLYQCVLVFRFLCCITGSECKCMTVTWDVFHGNFVYFFFYIHSEHHNTHLRGPVPLFVGSYSWIWLCTRAEAALFTASAAAPPPAYVITRMTQWFTAPIQTSTPCTLCIIKTCSLLLYFVHS